jgi:hypothetical protein
VRCPPRPPSRNALASAWQLCYDSRRAEGRSDISAEIDANEAYREAMPVLSDRESIRDFIACTANGMLIDAIQYQHGTQLLYAAQVALSTLNRKPQPSRPPGRPKKLTK